MLNGASVDLVRMEDIVVHYDGTEALRGVCLRVGRNEVVGLLGDNGAGKSTLAHVLIGYKKLTAGKIQFDGRPVLFKSPMQAREAGIETAYQDLALIDGLTVTRNFFLGREICRTIGPLRILDRQAMERVTSGYLSENKLAAAGAAHAKLGSLSIGQKRAIAIGRAIFFGAKLLILDEPLAGLSDDEAEQVLGLVKAARNKGLSVVFITHNAHEVFDIADRFVVLDRGRNYVELCKESTDYKELDRLLISSKLTTVREMTAEVAHQIRNPLAIMKVSAEMLRDDFRVETNQEEFRRITGVMISEIDTLSALVKNFMDFARPPRLVKSRCDVAEVIRKAVSSLPMERYPRNQLSIRTPERALAYLMDRNLIVQVISNLVMNALEASAEDSPVEVRAFIRDSTLCIEVEDWGCGMDEVAKRRMFMPFFTTKTAGTGFGLPIVQRIIEQHHGTVEVDSRVNEGTTVRIIMGGEA